MAEISKICLSNPKKTKVIVKSQHFIPPLLHRKLLGELIFLIQIKKPLNLTFDKNVLPLTEKISEIIINGLKTNYYTPENLKDSENIEVILENTLQKVNRLLFQEIIGSKIFEKFINNLNAIVAVIKEEKVYFSPVGNIQAFILRKNKNTPLVSPEEKNHQTTFKTFVQIISGSLEKEDVLIFSTDNFLDYFNFEKLKTLVLKQPVSLAIKNLEKILENLKEEVSLGAFLIKKEEVKISETMPEEKKVVIKIKKEEKIPTKVFVQPVEGGVEEISIKEKVEEKIKIPVTTEKKIIIEQKEEKEEVEKTEKAIKKPILRLKLPKISLVFLSSRWKNLSDFVGKNFSLVKPKLIYLIIIALAILLAFSLVRANTQTKITTKFFLSLQEIQEKNTLLKASLTYGDKKMALVLVEEIKNKIALLQPKNKAEKEILENLKRGFEENQANLYKIKKIEKVKIIADFSSLLKDDQLRGLARQNKHFFVFDEKKKEIYEIDQEKSKILSLGKIDLAIRKIINYTSDGLLLTTEDKIYLFDRKNKKISPLKLQSKQKALSINDSEIYDHKLYILDQKNNQILKYLRIDNGFGQESNWLKEKIDLKNITSIAIDGSIYFLQENGEILKFYLGKKTKFDQEKIYPELKKVVKLITAPDFKNIYLLEPTNKRIIIFDKNGKLIKQIISDQFTNLKDFLVDEKETKLWLLDGNKIMEISLSN